MLIYCITKTSRNIVFKFHGLTKSNATKGDSVILKSYGYNDLKEEVRDQNKLSLNFKGKSDSLSYGFGRDYKFTNGLWMLRNWKIYQESNNFFPESSVVDLNGPGME